MIGIRRLVVATTLALRLFTSPLSAAEPKKAAGQAADLLITNAKIYTLDDKQPWAEAVAIAGDRIIFVGSAREVKAYKGARTKVIDAAGKLVMPGIEDNH